MMIEYRTLDDVASFEQIVDLEIAVWHLAPRDAVPSSLFHAITINGGLLIGAYDGSRAVGMGLAFPARKNSDWLLWSHMVGVHPDYQGLGIGATLKRMQREWALQHGYKTISWTFDPLQRGNANLNLHLLGATANIYHVNFYGEMADSINAGLPSDRLEIAWDLSSKRAVSFAQGNPPAPIITNCDLSDVSVLRGSDDGTPQVITVAPGSPYLFAEVPKNLTLLKQSHPQLALAWRMAQRATLQDAFSNGYTAVDFISIDDRAGYLLQAPQAWYLYVLRCSDDTFYTGITVDLDRRVAQHNAGRGAAYTATRRPTFLIASWCYMDRGAALKAEAAFKKLSRQKKQQMIEHQLPYRDTPFLNA